MTRRESVFDKVTWRAGLIGSAVVAAGLAFAAPQASAQEVTVASWGGTYQEALRKAFYTPATQATGITIKDVTLKGIADVRLQVKANAVVWDIAELFGGGCEQARREGLSEELDYSVIKTDGVPPQLVNSHWVAINAYSTVMAWNTETVKSPPKNWADFFDAKRVKGTRAISPQSVTVEMALLADGVPKDKLYPLDLDRAFKKLAQFKPDVTTFWMTGAASTQLVMSGEVDMMSIWTSRIDAAKKEGAKFDFTYEGGLLSIQCLMVPKGAKNKKEAMKVIAAMLTPDIQANLPHYVAYSPINEKAFATGKIPPALAATLNSSPENRAKQVVVDVMWWADHGQEVQERFDALMK
jgi:putative spermidine/putrescine transport system substrate-binding protein